MSRQSGFTLIEIMIAVAILAIIAAIAIPTYQGYIAEGRITTAIKDLRQAELILTDLASDMNLAALDSGNTALRGVYMDASGRLVLGDTGTAPTGARAWLDPWGQIYLYQRPATRTAGGVVSNNSVNPQGFDLFSRGEDTTAGTSDDIMRGCNGEFIGEAAHHPAC